MRELPVGLSGRASHPDTCTGFHGTRRGADQKLNNMLKDQDASQQSRAVQMRAFWAATLPAALNRVHQVESPVARTLRVLERMVDAGTAG